MGTSAKRDERSLAAVPRWALALFVLSIAAYGGWQAAEPRPLATAAQLERPLGTPVLRAMSLGEPITLAHALVLRLQAYDNQPGISIPFKDLDYDRVILWLATVLNLDPLGQYPLMMAAQIYSQVPDPTRQRLMCEFVHRQFVRDPERRWRWLAHCAIMSKHRLRDMPLALRYAADITRLAGTASNWARQMRIFILEDMGEVAEATVLLGGLLATGEITDPAEARFLTQRLEEMKSVEKSSGSVEKPSVVH
jgi:hypothetical protein